MRALFQFAHASFALAPKSKVVDAFGFKHLISVRMAHGESLKEACYTACKAVMAAVNGQQVKASGNQIKLQLDRYSGVLIGKWENTSNAWVITGFKEDCGKSSADDRRRALHLAASYAPDSFGGLKKVGAALDYAVSRLAREYKQNNADVRRKADGCGEWEHRLRREFSRASKGNIS